MDAETTRRHFLVNRRGNQTDIELFMHRTLVLFHRGQLCGFYIGILYVHVEPQEASVVLFLTFLGRALKDEPYG